MLPYKLKKYIKACYRYRRVPRVRDMDQDSDMIGRQVYVKDTGLITTHQKDLTQYFIYFYYNIEWEISQAERLNGTLNTLKKMLINNNSYCREAYHRFSLAFCPQHTTHSCYCPWIFEKSIISCHLRGILIWSLSITKSYAFIYMNSLNYTFVRADRLARHNLSSMFRGAYPLGAWHAYILEDSSRVPSFRKV